MGTGSDTARLIAILAGVAFTLWTLLWVAVSATINMDAPPGGGATWPFFMWVAPLLGWAIGGMVKEVYK